MKVEENVKKYNNVKMWQMALFSLNTAAVNVYLALMVYMSYYANQVAGFGVVLISMVLTAMKVFDGITDPIAGFLLDITQGKFGKFRPFMIIGNLLMAVSVVLLFFTTHRINNRFRLIYFILIYMVYVIGFTCQSVVCKTGQTVMTNNPNQRPVTTFFDSLCIMASFGATALFTANYLIPKYSDYDNPLLYRDFAVTVIVVSFICTILAMIGIWSKDRPGFYGKENKENKETMHVRPKDYIEIMRKNKPIKMLIIAACTDKFAATVYSEAAVIVMLYGILMNNYKIAGLIGIVTAIPSLLVVSTGIKMAQKIGQKKTFVFYSWMCIVFQVLLTFVLMNDKVDTISFTKWNIISVVFVILFSISNGAKSVSNNMVVPMIADCSDYEVYRSGKYVPGLMGALFSFVDKVVTALGTAFVGIVLAISGYGHSFPKVTDPCTPRIRILTILFYSIIPMIGWAFSIYVMKHYELDRKKMQEIHEINR